MSSTVIALALSPPLSSPLHQLVVSLETRQGFRYPAKGASGTLLWKHLDTAHRSFPSRERLLSLVPGQIIPPTRDKMDALMSGNIWNSLSMFPRNRETEERERERGKVIRSTEKKKKKRNNLYRDACTGTNHY